MFFWNLHKKIALASTLTVGICQGSAFLSFSGYFWELMHFQFPEGTTRKHECMASSSSMCRGSQLFFIVLEKHAPLSSLSSGVNKNNCSPWRRFKGYIENRHGASISPSARNTWANLSTCIIYMCCHIKSEDLLSSFTSFASFWDDVDSLNILTANLPANSVP